MPLAMLRWLFKLLTMGSCPVCARSANVQHGGQVACTRSVPPVRVCADGLGLSSGQPGMSQSEVEAVKPAVLFALQDFRECIFGL